MKASVDKFGRFRGGNGKTSINSTGTEHLNEIVKLVELNHKGLLELPKKLPGFINTYIERHKEEKIVPLIKNIVETEINEHGQRISAGLDKVPPYLIALIEKHKNEKIVPLIEESITRHLEAPESKIKEVVQKIFDEKFENKRLKINKLETDLKKIKSDSQDELKALSDITRAFVYKITTPGYQRNSLEKENNLRRQLKKESTTTTWRHAFPEVPANVES